MNQQNFPVNSNNEGRRPQSGPSPGGVMDAKTAAQVHRRPPVAAVIRPMQRVNSTDQSVRIDAAEPETVRAPHMRTHQLEDYVSWLREQAKRNPRAAIQEAAERMVTGRPPVTPATNSPSIRSSSPSPSATHLSASDTPPVAKASVATPPVVKSPVIKTNTVAANAKYSFSIKQTQRSDQAHARAGAHKAAPIPNLSPADFKFEADLERILKKLNMPEVLLPSEPPKKQLDERGKLAVKKQQEKQFQAQASEAQFSDSQFSESQSPESQTPESQTPEHKLRSDAAVDTDHIIHTISQAIASVLNDQSHASVESKIRSKLKTLTQSAGPPSRDSISAEVANSFEQGRKISKASTTSVAEDVKSNSKTEVPVKAQGLPAENTNRVVRTPSPKSDDLEIPTSIAAWDVEDFRWPKVSNQMISTGGRSIELLAGSVFDTLKSSNKKRLAVTSSGRGEGTTAIAISLARWAAAAGRRVLLVDADLASPDLSTLVGLGPNISWVNAISRSLDPSEVTIRSQRTPLCIMPLAPLATRVRCPRFIYDQLGDLINPIVGGFDLVLFDLGPVDQLLAELSRARSLLDAALIVHNINAPENFLNAQERLETFGIDRFVVAQNTVHPNSAPRANVA